MRIGGSDRQGLERLLRYCARPPFAAERLEELDPNRLIYHLPKAGFDGRTQLVLSPLELIERIAALVPPPRSHRHRYYGVLAPNSPLRAAVTALVPQPNLPASAVPAAEGFSPSCPLRGILTRAGMAGMLWRKRLDFLSFNSGNQQGGLKSNLDVISAFSALGLMQQAEELAAPAAIPPRQPQVQQ